MRSAPAIGASALGLGLLWWHWPALAPWLVSIGRGSAGAVPAVVVLAEDPRRTEAALDRWLQQPGSLLVMQGSLPIQQAARVQLAARHPTPQSLARVRSLLCGHDTLGQLTCLAEALRGWRHPDSSPVIGSVVLVTGREHLPRALAIARIVLGGQGLPVEGLAADTVAPPEHPLRAWRDLLRAQLWRATGWDGRPPFLLRGT